MRGQESQKRGFEWDGGRLAFSVEETAALLSISRSQAYRLIDSGELETVRIGRCRRVTRRQLEDFIRRIEGSGGISRLL
jgi:excisionase family DNA binding protein